jgi:hydroxypyruvate isomerase
MIFGEVSFYDRFRAAADAGLSAVEFWGWCGKDLDKIKALSEDNGLTVAAFCVSSEDGEFNNKRLLYSDGIRAFVEASKLSIEKARAMGTPSLIMTTGQERNDVTRYKQHTNIVLALKTAAPYYEEAGITLVLEPLNVLKDHRGYYLHSSYEAFGIAREVGSPAVKILYDIYHQQISEGNLIPTIRENIDLIGHFHTADVPGRNQPGTGEINYANVFAAIDKLGYDRYVGLEYSPTVSSAETIRTTAALAGI